MLFTHGPPYATRKPAGHPSQPQPNMQLKFLGFDEFSPVSPCLPGALYLKKHLMFYSKKLLVVVLAVNIM
jgi:hypothetical protein